MKVHASLLHAWYAAPCNLRERRPSAYGAGMTAIPQPSAAETELRRLLDIMATLRDPDRGCPWDKEQDFSTIAPYTIEEGYEVADAIARGDLASLPDELGDLLFQVVYHARMAEEAGSSSSPTSPGLSATR